MYADDTYVNTTADQISRGEILCDSSYDKSKFVVEEVLQK